MASAAAASMSAIVFSLTKPQADALRSLAAGRFVPKRDRFGTRLVGVLRERGFITSGWSLTPLGRAAAALCDALAAQGAL